MNFARELGIDMHVLHIMQQAEQRDRLIALCINKGPLPTATDIVGQFHLMPPYPTATDAAIREVERQNELFVNPYLMTTRDPYETHAAQYRDWNAAQRAATFLTWNAVYQTAQYPALSAPSFRVAAPSGTKRRRKELPKSIMWFWVAVDPQVAVTEVQLDLPFK